MEIENKWEVLDKEPEIGALVVYKDQININQQLKMDYGIQINQRPDLGLVLHTYNQGFEGDDLETAYVMWAVGDEDGALFSELSVISTGSIIHDS